MRALLTVSCCLAGVAAAAPVAAAASFDCAKARAPIEKTICGDAALSELDGRLAAAYRRALALASDPEALKTEQRAWLTGKRKSCADAVCLKQAYAARLAALERLAPAGKTATYSFTKAPFVSPKIINDLSTGVADQGDQVLAIDLSDSEESNRYAGDVKVVKTGNRNPYVATREEPVEGDSEPPPEFGYRFVGRTASGIDVLFTSESGGGSGVFESLMLVRVSEETGAPSITPDSGPRQTMTFRGKRLVIRKLGEIGLGDRWDGELGVRGDEISIGADRGWFSDRTKTPGRVVKVEPPR
ncbi:MAG TPA: lysozyme inhibitor LprI family protein [Polyangia bacterium]|nr:lysozyme inhibitor LprI family protein [Polyangia bacterium]